MPTVTTETILTDLRERIVAGYSLIFLRTWEESRWEQLLADLALEMERGLVVWSRTQGWLPPPDQPAADLPGVIAGYPDEHLFLLKDFQTELHDPRVVRQLRDLTERLPGRKQTLIFLDPVGEVPLELDKDAVRMAPPLPDYNDLRATLDELLASPAAAHLELDPDHEDRLIKAVLGLTLREAQKAWSRVIAGRTTLDDRAIDLLIAEKRHMAAASDFLEFHDLSAGADDVGGLDELKGWLKRRALAYSPAAREQGIPLPKGALLLGVQGCGKSLTARATARMLSFPLLRLDLSRLLENGQGASERNLRNVLHLLESIAPVVLWLDELEKGFAGVEGDKFSDATMGRLLGLFLMWMQEQTHPVFVIATANSIHNLPPELLRRGRFDELFFIDLPNYHERHQILTIHLTRRGWKPERLRIDELAQRTEGFSGAELEQLVATAIIDAFGHNQMLNDEILDRTRRSLVPLSKTMEEKIFQLRQWAQDRCRRATSDNRAAQMLDEEARFGSIELESESAPKPTWAQLVEAGQLKGAIVEYIRAEGETVFPKLIEAFQPYVPAAGDQGLALRGDPNTVLWVGMHQEFCETLIELVANRRLYIHPIEVESYRQHGGLKLPLQPAPATDKLDRPHWFPSSIRNRPYPQYMSQLSRLRRIQLARGPAPRG